MRKILLFAVIALLAMTACRNATYLNANKESVVASRQGGADSIILRSDAGKFEILSSPEWVTPELKDTVLRLAIAENSDNLSRQGNVIVANGDLRLSISVKQLAPATYLAFDEKTITIGPNGEPATLKVRTDGADVRLDGVEGATSTYSDGLLTVSGKGNDGKTRKTSAKIVCDTITRQITVVETGIFCGRCYGKGNITCTICRGEGVDYCPYRPCDLCRGRKVISCPSCGGKGK